MTTSITAYTYVIPWPPSTNTLYRAFRGRNILSEKGREFYESGQTALFLQRPPRPLQGGLSVSITLHPPTRRKYDIDNRIKACLDLLTKAGVWDDDEQVTRLMVEKGERRPGGCAVLKVESRR